MPGRIPYRVPAGMKNALRGIRMGLGAASNVLSAATIQAYAANAGFSGSDLETATAIALAESGGNASVYNPETATGTPQGKGSYGLWQIYLLKHPEFAGMNLYDPQTNANAAYSVYSAAGGFTPWTTYNSGMFQQYMPLVAAASPGQTDSTGQPVTIDAATGEIVPNVDISALPTITDAGIVLPATVPSAFSLDLSDPTTLAILAISAAGIWWIATDL